jgi:hypothetical protein
MQNLLKTATLSTKQTDACKKTLLKRAEILAKGYLKREKFSKLEEIKRIIETYEQNRR